jgi:hypothetical protein
VYQRLVAIGKPIRPDGHFALMGDHFALMSGHFALLSDQGDRDALENRPFQVSCKHFVVPSTMCPHAHLARSPVGLADKVWLEAVGREPGENSPWYRTHVLAQRPKLATETLIPQEWLNLALSDATAAAVQTLRAGAPIGKLRLGCDFRPIPSQKADSKPLPDNNFKHEPPIFASGGGGHPLSGTPKTWLLLRLRDRSCLPSLSKN